MTDQELGDSLDRVAARAGWPPGVFVGVELTRGFDHADEPAVFATILLEDTSTEDFPAEAMLEAVARVQDVGRHLEDRFYVRVSEAAPREGPLTSIS